MERGYEVETEDATEEEREGEVILSERGEGEESEEGKDKCIKKKKI